MECTTVIDQELIEAVSEQQKLGYGTITKGYCWHKERFKVQLLWETQSPNKAKEIYYWGKTAITTTHQYVY